MKPAAILILLAVAGSPAAADTKDRIASISDFKTAAALCLEVADKSYSDVGLHFGRFGWSRMPFPDFYTHPTNPTLLMAAPRGVGCGAISYLASRLSPSALAEVMTQLGGHRTDGTPERSVWKVRETTVRAWISRESQGPGVSMIAGTFAMEKK